MSIEPTDPSVYLSGIDPRLVVTDMDGTLLDADSNIPERLWPLLRQMKERGIVFAPASGRQYFTLASLFEREIEGMPIIAENGGFVVRDGKEISSITLDRDELSTAEWFDRGSLPETPNLISLTGEMIECFRQGKEPR